MTTKEATTVEEIPKVDVKFKVSLLSGKQIEINGEKTEMMRRDHLGLRVHLLLMDMDLAKNTDEVYIARQSDNNCHEKISADDLVSGGEEGVTALIRKGEHCHYCKKFIQDCNCWEDEHCPRCGQCRGWMDSACWGPKFERIYTPLGVRRRVSAKLAESIL